MILIERSDFPIWVTIRWPKLASGGPILKWRHNLKCFLDREFPQGYIWETDYLKIDADTRHPFSRFRMASEEDAVLFKLKYDEAKSVRGC